MVVIFSFLLSSSSFLPLAVDPAAHLDLHSYQLYESAKQSLAVTRQPLVPVEHTNTSEPDPGCSQYENPKELTLEKCRMLKCRYFASEVSGNSSQLGELLELYSNLARQLQGAGRVGLACQAMNECGDLVHHKIGIR